MTERQRAPVAVAPHLRAIAALVVLGGALVACGAASSPGSSLAHAGASGPTTRATATTPQPRASLVGSARQRQLGLADGLIPDGTTVFDDGIPGITRLDPALLSALRLAAGTAASGGIEIFVTSGWRSRAYQEQLYREAVSKYGSSAEAAQWVAAPGESAHESGKAVDIGRADAIAWLSDHGAGYGLCQVYDNEPWHYELRLAAPRQGCPPRYADPSDDPRLQQ